MARIKTKQVQGVGRITLEYAIDQFMRHNRLKNLSPRTIEYYTEDLRYFQKITEVTYLDEITDKLYEDFILHEMDKGNKMTAVNCRTRGLRVFLRFCAKREYMELIHIPMMKEDETFKEPYTDAELQTLLKQPTSDSFVEWRCWAAINTFLATGIRASTLVNLRIGDVDFEHNTIHLAKLKNRKQQFVPLSQSLKTALTTYLKLWEWDSDDYIFPSYSPQSILLPDNNRHSPVLRSNRLFPLNSWLFSRMPLHTEESITNTCVRIPASFNRLLRSMPIIAPQQQATKRRAKKSIYCGNERC